LRAKGGRLKPMPAGHGIPENLLVLNRFWRPDFLPIGYILLLLLIGKGRSIIFKLLNFSRY
jgi:hypothetical protein